MIVLVVIRGYFFMCIYSYYQSVLNQDSHIQGPEEQSEPIGGGSFSGVGIGIEKAKTVRVEIGIGKKIPLIKIEKYSCKT